MITARHLTPTLTVIALAATGPSMSNDRNGDEQPSPYPPAPNLPIDGHYHPCTHPTHVNVVCSIQYGDAP